jgi:Ca2+-binding EF-hand superfamily protein
MADKFTAEQKAGYKAAFDEFDADGSGSIDTSELKEVFKKVGQPVSDEELADTVKEFDEDNNGEIDFQEFLAMMARLTSGPTPKDIAKEVFKMLDSAGSGSVASAELKVGLEKAGIAASDEEIEAMIAEVGPSSKGKLTIMEFVKAMQDAGAI